MKVVMKSILIGFALLTSMLWAADIDQIIEINEAAKAWVSLDGEPLYYTSDKYQYTVDRQSVKRMRGYSSDATISLSPNGEYRLVSRLQDMAEVKNGQRFSDYFVMDAHNDLLYTVNRGTESDLKPLVAAISNRGILALADPVKARIYFYEAGNLITEGQLYEDDGELSLERNMLVQWVNEQCYILLERPGFNGGPGGKSLFIRINADGRGQTTAPLPFTYLEKMVFQHNRFFVSGYDHHPATNEFNPMIVELNPRGQVLWTNENYGHEMQLSPNGEYLAVLSSHEFIQLFELGPKRVQKIRFDHADKFCLGLSVNNRGEVAVIRVAADFFAKRNTHNSQVFFPQSQQNADIQIDPRFPKLFQLQTNGDRFFIGTNYEWLEISQ